MSSPTNNPGEVVMLSPSNAYPALQDDVQALSPSLLLELFGQTPIAFHPIYVDVTGSLTAALWLAYAAYHVAESGTDPEGWFQKSQEEWALETRLTRREQESARARLRELGLLQERRGLNQPLSYRLVTARLVELLEAACSQQREHTAARTKSAAEPSGSNGSPRR